jgi:hypothetical protein
MVQAERQLKGRGQESVSTVQVSLEPVKVS